jgi:hypothetical protein
MTALIRRFHNFPVLCLLVLSLLSSPISALGYVWCFSAEGYAALETAMAGDCGADSPTLVLEDIITPSLTTGEDDCGPCLDVSASYQYGAPNGREDEIFIFSLAESTAVSVDAHIPLPERSLNKNLFTDQSPRISDLILQHRTIVLLI